MKRIFYILTIAFLTSCGPGQKTKEELTGAALIEARHDEVMVVHDEVMPKMGTIRKLKKGIEVKIDSFQTMGDSVSVELLRVVVSELEGASDAMMVWMRSYEKPSEGTSDDEVAKYYEGEMVKVMDVREEMLGTIEKAESIE